jgi:hypothetical protein
MPAKRHTEKPNVNASVYGGEFSLIVECPPSGRCKRARFYAEPPEDDEPCIYMIGCQGCTCPAAHADVVEALRDRLNKKLKELDGEMEA